MADVCFTVSLYEQCDMSVVSVSDDAQPEASSDGIASRCRNKTPVSQVVAVYGAKLPKVSSNLLEYMWLAISH